MNSDENFTFKGSSSVTNLKNNTKLDRPRETFLETTNQLVKMVLKQLGKTYCLYHSKGYSYLKAGCDNAASTKHMHTLTLRAKKE